MTRALHSIVRNRCKRGDTCLVEALQRRLHCPSWLQPLQLLLRLQQIPLGKIHLLEKLKEEVSKRVSLLLSRSVLRLSSAWAVFSHLHIWMIQAMPLQPHKLSISIFSKQVLPLRQKTNLVLLSHRGTSTTLGVKMRQYVVAGYHPILPKLRGTVLTEILAGL
jgi:hypothetical protein